MNTLRCLMDRPEQDPDVVQSAATINVSPPV